MSVPPPITIEVYDKAFTRRGVIGAPKFATIIPRHNAIGGATIGVLASDRMVPELFTAGARMRILDDNGQHLMSGPVKTARGRGPQRTSLLEFDVEDDFRILGQILGWVQPAEAIDDQGIAGDNWVMTDNAETVLKAAVQANGIDRLGLPLTCATDLGRGSIITAKLRFHPLFDRLFPVIDGAGLSASGIGVTVRQIGAGLVLDVYEPSVYPRVLTEASGVITDWAYSSAAPEATRVVVGGQGEAQLRVFRHLEDTAREAEWGQIIERFRDARDTDDNLTLYARGQETLDEGAPKSGLSLTLSQTPNFRYNTAITVGDQVTMRVGPGTQITDIVTEATLSWTKDDGWKATPKVGERSDDADTMLVRAIRSIARSISNSART